MTPSLQALKHFERCKLSACRLVPALTKGLLAHSLQNALFHLQLVGLLLADQLLYHLLELSFLDFEQ